MENDLNNGAPGMPTPPASSDGASPSAVDVDKLAEALLPRIRQEVERTFQSGKDKRIGQLTGRVDGFESQLAEFRKWTDKGKSDEEALLLMQMARSISSAADPQPNPAAPAAPDGKPAAQTPSVDAELLAVLGLSGTDPDVLGLLAQGKTDAQSYIDLAKARRAKPTAPAAPATILPTGGGSAAAGEDLDTITAELSKLMANPGPNMVRIMELQRKHKALLTGQ